MLQRPRLESNLNGMNMVDTTGMCNNCSLRSDRREEGLAQGLRRRRETTDVVHDGGLEDIAATRESIIIRKG